MTQVTRRSGAIVGIGASWGGTGALRLLLGDLPRSFREPLILVLHRPNTAMGDLAEVIAGWTSLRVLEPNDGDPIERGHVYVAPAGYHMLVDGSRIALSLDGPESYARPSVDALFHSLAESAGPRAVGVVLTGANHDGARGLARIKDSGGRTIVQEPMEAERAEMPRAALATGRVDHVLKLAEIARWLGAMC